MKTRFLYFFFLRNFIGIMAPDGMEQFYPMREDGTDRSSHEGRNIATDSV
jgi:hypothetical protein